FEKQQLPVLKKTKTGPSTDYDVLEQLAAMGHEVPRLLIEYRELAKLKSTYVDALPGFINPRTGRIHTSYNQAGAATGRLSSSDPNLQNIPVRTPRGEAIRRAFVAAPGWLLLTADYSQVELRLLAHLSGDPAFVRAWLDRTVAEARERGYVETLFGRRRYIPELKDRNFNIRAFGERTATNSPLQGSAADLIKIAMISIERAVRERGLAARMLLQV